MKVIEGIAVSAGIARGRAVVIERLQMEPERKGILRKQINREKRRLKRAFNKSLEQIKELIAGLKEGEHEHFEVLKAHQLMLQDERFCDASLRFIEQWLVNAEWALWEVAEELKKEFLSAPDNYIRARAEDVEFVKRRVMANLKGVPPDPVLNQMKNAIVVAHMLSPGNLARLIKEGIVGLALDLGSETSHTSIIARALGIPAVVGLGNASEKIKNGEFVIVDGLKGLLIASPDEDTVAEYERVKARFSEFERKLLEERELPAETRDGFRVMLSGNLDTEDEIPELLSHGAEGLALVRTEFLYLNGNKEPDEDTQFQWYKKILTAMGDKPVTFRTLDVGGEKFPLYWRRPEEANPALGLRAVRFCLAHPHLFKTQLRALLRASVYGNMKIMFPLIMGVSEMRQVKQLLFETMDELREEGIEFDENIKIGAMIELPSAAIVADLIAKEVDFFSIGTNDLIQYTLAIDRTNEHLREQYHPLHAAIMRLLKSVTEAAQNNGVEVSLCGEMGGEPMYVPLLIAMGITELGMTARSIPYVKRLVRSITLNESRDLLQRVLELDSFESIEELVRTEIGDRFPELCYNRF